jgi:hypothetical protein
VRKCKFIRSTNAYEYTGDKIHSIFVPPPTSVFGGWARHQWLKGYFGKECAVVGKEMWGMLLERYEVKVLIEDDGRFWEENEE